MSNKFQTNFFDKKIDFVHNKNLIINVDGKVVSLHDDIVFWVKMGRKGHLSMRSGVSLEFLNFLRRRIK